MSDVSRIEEAQMYTDRAVEELNQQVIELHHKLEKLAARVVALEGNLRATSEASGPEPDQTEP